MEDIPQFPDLEPIELKHKEFLLNYFKSIQPVISELNFVEIFAWRKLRKIYITEYENNIVLFLEKKGKKYFYPPFSRETDKIILELLTYFKLKNEDVKVNAYPDDLLYLLENIIEKITLEDDRDNYDYIYLDKIRQHTHRIINTTDKHYQCTYHPYNFHYSLSKKQYEKLNSHSNY